MTRLVSVRAVCDGCSAAAAAVFCVSHRNVLCHPCDRAKHNTHSTASHQRVDLSSAVTALPFCEQCDDAPATTYCESEGATLCDKCDNILHQAVETRHWRTPIERTLRSRVVEFRETSQTRQPPRSCPSPVNDSNSLPQRVFTPVRRDNRKDSPNPKHQTPHPDPLPSTASPTRQRPMSPSAITFRPLAAPVSSVSDKGPTTLRVQQSQTPQQGQIVAPAFSAAPFIPPQHNPTQQRRRPRPLAKRKRDMQRLTQQLPNPKPPEVRFSRTNVLSTDGLLGYPPIARTSEPTTYPFQADLSPQQESQVQPLQEPLLMATDSRYLDFEELNYESLEMSGEATAIEGLNGSGKSASLSDSFVASGRSSRRETPDMDMLSAEPRVPRNTPSQAALREVMASAVAAAGEQYLLNNVSSGSGSSGEGESPPVNMSCAPDPAGLVAAATAAAVSAAAQAAAGADLDNQVLKGTPEALGTDTMTEVLDERGRHARMSRRASEGGIPSARDMAKVEAAREAISDEAMRRLEIETPRTKEVSTVDDGELVAQMSDGEEMGYLEISRDDFGGVFDAIDLSQFEQNGSGEFRPALDFDEG